MYESAHRPHSIEVEERRNMIDRRPKVLRRGVTPCPQNMERLDIVGTLQPRCRDRLEKFLREAVADMI
ncbi:hypothetical protein [Nocardia sp. Marseille-Q1738]